MKHIILSFILANLSIISCWAVSVEFINNTGHRVAVEPVRRYTPRGASPLEQGQTIIGGSTLIPAGDQDIATRSYIYQDVDFTTLDSYNVYYPAGYIRAYLPATKISGRGIAQRAAQVNASHVEITLTAGYTGIGYTINAIERPQTGTTQPITLEESFIGIGMQDPLEIQQIYQTIDKNPDDPPHVLFDLKQPPAQRALPDRPLSHQPYAIQKYVKRLKDRYDVLEKYYKENRSALDDYYSDIANYTDKMLELHKKAHQQLKNQLGL